MQKLFTKNINNQLGTIYTIKNYPNSNDIVGIHVGKKDKTYLKKYHEVESMGNIEDAVDINHHICMDKLTWI